MRMKWACPKYGGIRVVWCGPCLRLRMSVSSCGRGSGWLCRREGGDGHPSAHSTDSTCGLNIGGDKYCMHAHTHTSQCSGQF